MRISLSRLVLLGALPLLAACGSKPTTDAASATSAADLDRAFITAWNNKDLEKTLIEHPRKISRKSDDVELSPLGPKP